MPRLRTLSALSATACLTAATALTATAAPSPTPGVVGNKPSFSPDLSGNGRYVVFASDATNLVPGDTNGKRDIFVRDTVNKTTRLVSKGLGGKLSNGASYSPSISDDGRYVAYTSQATNLVTGDTNSKVDAFRTDLTTGTTIRVSVGAANAQGNGVSEGARISGNGALIVFGSTSSNLVKGDTNNVADVFLRDTTTGTTRRLSMTPQGNQNVYPSTGATISPSGSVIGFIGPVGGHTGLFQWNKTTGTTTLIRDGGPDITFGQTQASNGGLSYAFRDEGDPYYTAFFVEVVASPTKAFEVNDWDWSTSFDNVPFDVSKWGAMVVALTSDHAAVADNYIDLSDPSGELATLYGYYDAVAFSSDGNTVTLRDGNAGQIVTWAWRTSTTTTVVSVN